MHARRAALIAVAATLAALAALAACGDDHPAGPTVPTDIVGILELPVSHRGDSPAPQNAVRIDVSPTELHVSGQQVLTLANGALPAGAAGADHVITKVRAAIQAAGGHTAAELRVHASTPYATTVDILATLLAANIRTASFQVRHMSLAPPILAGSKRPHAQANVGTNTGWLEIRNWKMVPNADDEVTIEGVTPIPWDDFARVWDEVYTQCRSGEGSDCVPKGDIVMPGGNAQIVLRSRGDGVKIDVVREGAAWDAGVPVAPHMIPGVPAPQAGDEIPPEPVTEAGFTMRQAETTAPSSAISDMMRPICGSRACPIVVMADPETMTMRVLSLLGAAFPDGSTAPTIAFVTP